MMLVAYGWWMPRDSYRVRAHAVGLGAKIVNEQLRAMDLASLTCSEACRQILEIMVNGSGDTDETKQDSPEKEDTPWRLPHDARVELAFVKPTTTENESHTHR